jgi:hypothetical protein
MQGAQQHSIETKPAPFVPKVALVKPLDQRGKKKINTLKMYLAHYYSFAELAEDMPLLDDIVTGSSLLDFGDNKKPLRRDTLFFLLKELEIITATGVRAVHNCGVRHSQKLALCLRVIVNAANTEASRSYPQAVAKRHI